MTQKPEEYAHSASDRRIPPSFDALSDVLLRAGLRGEDALLHAPAPPFHITVPEDAATIHFALGDPLLVRFGDRAPVLLAPGDFVLVRQGIAHSVASTGDDSPQRVLGESDRGDPAEATRGWLRGRFRSEHDAGAPLMSVLPAVVHITAAGTGGEWLGLSLGLLLEEVSSRRPGASIMISRILDLLFIHALREWSASDRVEPGWLATALDERLAPALAAIHRHPEHPWTVDDLAALAHQSRSAFAHRFTALLGMSPVAYLAEQRMDMAARLLESTTMPVGAVAEAVGFASDAAFSRAFRRRHGMPPLTWRRVEGSRVALASSVGRPETGEVTGSRSIRAETS